jgi:UDP-N-acetylglucosamine/UDP-N-acetylgalactosamine diphosphorylase
MDRVPEKLERVLREHDQQHVLDSWNDLTAEQRKTLVRHLERLDLGELRTLFERRHEKTSVPPTESIAPLPRPAEGHDAELRQRGLEAFERGEVAFLIVAGGQGTRLGFDQPKGMYEIGPVSRSERCSRSTRRRSSH